MLLTTIATTVGRADPRPTTVGVPAYGYPALGPMWTELAKVRPGTVVIVNPASGPGIEVDPVYEQALAPVRAAGAELYGYVDIDYGRRAIAAVLEDVEMWRRLYQPDGIFLDQFPAGDGATTYLGSIAPALRAEGLQIAINPGQPLIDPPSAALVDHVVNFEGTLAQYEAATFPGWVLDAPADRFWHLVYDVHDERDLDEVLIRAGANRASTVFVTDGIMPNPWDHLPPYWDLEVERVAAG